MQKVTDVLFRGIEVLLVVFITTMAIMVFGNVVLRYGFNSGITISEEASRFIFIWLTFLGSIIAMKGKAHIGVDTLIKHLPKLGKQICAILSDVLILGCCVLFFIGSWKQTVINLKVAAPVTEWPMAVIYSVGLVNSSLIGIYVLTNLIQVLRGKVKEEDLIAVVETEEIANLDPRHSEKIH
jgi:TRAP-type transport system small permease protein